MHVTEGMQRRWVFPTLSDDSSNLSNPSSPQSAPNPLNPPDHVQPLNVPHLSNSKNAQNPSIPPNPSEFSNLPNPTDPSFSPSPNPPNPSGGNPDEISSNGAVHSRARRRLSVEGLVPFWLDLGAVPNTFAIDSMVLLTGPNTSGTELLPSCSNFKKELGQQHRRTEKDRERLIYWGFRTPAYSKASVLQLCTEFPPIVNPLFWPGQQTGLRFWTP